MKTSLAVFLTMTPTAEVTPNHVLDDLVKEYLVFRGFIPTLKSLESELKYEREKGFRCDK